jgi:hypothetical protein
LGEKAPDLARELGRLPDLADGVDPKEIAGLEAIHQSYSGRPDAWARVFEAMNRVGLPDRRRYLAPLQALFWRAQDGGAAALNRMVDGYDLTRLLDQAWKPDPRRGWKDFDTVADRLQAPELAAWYLKHRFSYQWDAMDRPRDDRTTFQKGGGVCRHWASFATHCLIRNGYLAKNLTVWWDVDDHRGHTVTVIRRPEGLYVAADSTRPGIYDGPFADYMAVGESLTKERITAYKLETNTGLYQSDVDIYGE